MAPKGPILPRKSTALKRSSGSLESVAFQIGTIVSVERNRSRSTQAQLASQVGVKQEDISSIENGVATKITNAQFDKLFHQLGLPKGGAHVNYLKWWRDNG